MVVGASVQGFSDRRFPGVLDKLVLQITNFCNMRCAYCITQYGDWGATPSARMMAPEMVELALRKFAGCFDRIYAVNFFGGEPFLNPAAMEAAGLEAERLQSRGVLLQRPHLSTATNGTVVNRKITELIKKYGIRFVVSVDGPRELHDLRRVDGAHKGTYDKIRKNVGLLKEATGYPKGLAFTYTVDHLRSDMTLWDMLKVLRDDFGLREFAVMPATNCPANPGQWDPLLEDPERFIDEYTDAITRSMWELVNHPQPIMLQYVRTALAKLVEAPAHHECPAGRSYFSVSAEGGVFPCQNLPDDPEFRITAIQSGSFAEDLQSSSVRDRIVNANLKATAMIGDDPARSLCRICPSDNLGETRSLTEYSPARFKLYRAIDAAVKTAFTEIVGSGEEQRRSRFLDALDR